jgi:hypothetical protein
MEILISNRTLVHPMRRGMRSRRHDAFSAVRECLPPCFLSIRIAFTFHSHHACRVKWAYSVLTVLLLTKRSKIQLANESRALGTVIASYIVVQRK